MKADGGAGCQPLRMGCVIFPSVLSHDCHFTDEDTQLDNGKFGSEPRSTLMPIILTTALLDFPHWMIIE